MQATINMAQALLERGHQLWEQDRYEEATRVLSRLLGLRVIPATIAERAQFYLGDMHLAQGHYAKARRHLAAAIANGTSTGETHFLMGCALDWDEDGDARHAYQHYRRAVKLEPGQPLYSSVYAVMRIRRKAGRSKYDREALWRLRDAFAAEPSDPDIVYNYIYGLMEMGRYLEAELALRRAKKRWPSHPAFEELWHDFLIRCERVPRPRSLPGAFRPLRLAGDDGPVLLRFPVNASSAHRRQRLRPDAQS